MIRGKKTYAAAVGVAVVAVLQYLAVIGQDEAIALYGLLGAGGAAALRHGFKK